MEQAVETAVIIVGGGPSGLATAACLNLHSVTNVVLEKAACHSSLWKLHAYDRVKLHLAKSFCALPHMPHPPSTPTYITREHFIEYLDNYVNHFGVNPVCGRIVEEARYENGRWVVFARRVDEETPGEGVIEKYVSRWLVVATGENGEAYLPVTYAECFTGEVVHSRDYGSGEKYKGQSVLVVGSGNSGMEIAYDLACHGAMTSICIRSTVHVVTREFVHMGMLLLRYGVPLWLVDKIVLFCSFLKFGDLSMYGIVRPKQGPFAIKAAVGRSPVLDVGTVKKIKSGEIHVLPEITSIKGKQVEFANGKTQDFDTMIFATGYKSTALKWLKDHFDLLNSEGFPKKCFPDQWKGKNGLYFAGFAKKGLIGVSMDAKNIAKDIRKEYYGGGNN